MSAVTPEKATSDSNAKALVTAIVTNVAVLLVEVGAFMILRRHIRKIYAPRTYLPPPSRRSQPLGTGYFSWIPAIIWTPATDIIHKNGLDAYFFLRLLRLLLNFFTVATVLSFAVLVPLNYVHQEQLTTGLARIAWGNIPDELSVRYTGHVVIAYVLTFYAFYLMRQELRHLITLRQQYLTSKTHSKIAQARTVLITGIPKDLLNEKALRDFASFAPGGVSNIWIYRESKALTELYEDRLDACSKLETAVTNLLRRATRVQAKRAVQSGHRDTITEPSMAILNDLVPPNKRPRHRLGPMGLFGKKVDTIEWAKAVIPDLDRRIAAARHDLPHVKPAGSAFIEFNLQIGAHVMDQCLSYHEPLQMVDKWVEVSADDILWSNIDDGSYETRARFVMSWAATIGLIVGFAPIAAFVTSLSNLSALCTKAHWLEWVCRAPSVAVGLLQGVLPPLLMAILFLVIPLILKFLAWFECVPRNTLISQRVQERYFIFLVVHGFITGTLASGLIAAIPQALDNPKSIVQQLANNLPKASIYFLTYIFGTGFTGAGMAFLQLVPLIMHYIKKWLLGRTPREAYSVSFIMPSVDFGLITPPLSLTATIGLSYSVIHPLLNVTALSTVGLLWFAYKYLFLYIMDQPEHAETGGLYLPRAINHLFVGLYVQQITVAALLFLRVPIEGARLASILQGVFMLLLIVFTFLAQALLTNSFHDLLENLPMSLATKHMRERYDEERKKSGLESFLPDEMDLFSREHIRAVVKHTMKHSKTHLGLPNLSTANLHVPKILKLGSPTSSHTHGWSEHGSSTSVNRHLGSSDMIQHGPNITVSSSPLSHRPLHSAPLTSPSSARLAEPDTVTRDTEDDADIELDEHAFDHPSTYKAAPWIWVPRDLNHLSEVIVEDLVAAGVQASDLGASVDAKGVVKVSRNPPDEEWEGGLDA